MSAGELVAGAALAAVGVPFRLHGRGADGLDCVGLVARALRAADWRGEVPTGYRLRRGDARVVAGLLDAGLVRCDGAAMGDVLLMRTGPGQLHLGVRVAGGLVHADAGLRRVVMRPGVVAWPVVGAWRLASADSPSPDLPPPARGSATLP